MNAQQIRAEIQSLNEELGVTNLNYNRRDVLSEIKDLERELKGIEPIKAKGPNAKNN